SAGWQGLDPCLNKRIDEHDRTAIENRNLGVVDLDHEIVDAEPGHGGHQVLDGHHLVAIVVSDRGAEVGLGDLRSVSTDQASLGARIDALEDDPLARRGRVEMDSDRLAAMYADAGQADALLQCCLLIHGTDPVSVIDLWTS